MSLVHYTYVGHFDPRTVRPDHLACSRPLDPERVARLLAEYPQEVEAHVTVCDGYARCQWAVGGWVSDPVFAFAYWLAREEGCLAVENGRQVMYPPEAARAQAELWERLFGRPGLADERERAARAQAEELERRANAPADGGRDPGSS